MKFSHAYSAFLRQPWAITPEMHDVLGAILLERASGHKPDLETIDARIEAAGTYGSGVGGVRGTEESGIAVITLHGVIFSRAQSLERMSGATHPQVFAKLVDKAAKDPGIQTLVIGVDSPGGTVSGLGIAAEAVRRARDKKRVIAVIDDMACSAAYWIACQAGEVVVPDGGIVGSIGVIATHMDYSRMLATEGVKPTVLRSADLKGLGSPVEPLTGKALEQLKAEVQRYHEQFVLEISRGRKVSLDKAASWATGETWLGTEAVKLGLADRIGSMSTVLEELQAGPDEGDDEEDAPEDITVLVNPDNGSDAEDNPDLDARATQENASVLEQDGPIAAVPDAPSAQQPDAPDSPSWAKQHRAIHRALTGLPAPSSPVPEGGNMNLQAIFAKVRAGIALNAEEATFLEARTTTPEAVSAPDPLASLPPEARKMLESAQHEARLAREEASAERNIRLSAHYGARASELGLEAAMGPVLMRASSAISKEDYESLEQSYRAKAEQDKSAALFATKGHIQAAPGTAKAEVSALVQTAMEGNAQLDFITAQIQVLAANPVLASRLMSEQASQN